MKTVRFWLFTVLLMVGMVLTACAAPAAPTPPTPMPPTATSEVAPVVDVAAPAVVEVAPVVPIVESDLGPEAAVVLAMVERANAGDYAGAAELVSDDFKAYFLGMPPTGFEFYDGKAAFQTFLEECCTGQNFVWEVKPVKVAQGIVTAESKTWVDFTRELGVAPNDWNEVFMVEDGLITGYWSVITEESLAKFKPALCAAVPEFCPEPDIPPADEPVSEVTVTLEDGMCSYDGPMVLKAGDIEVTAQVMDEEAEPYALSFFTIDEGHDFVDLMATTYNPGPPSWSKMIFLREVAAGETVTRSFNVDEGLVYMICWAKPTEMPVGQAGPFEVQAAEATAP